MAAKTKAKKAAPKAAAKKRAAPQKKVAKPIPDGYHQITPYLAIKGAAAAIDFYKKVFGAKERLRMNAPNGLIGHAEVVIGNSVVMLADEFPPMDFLGPKSRGGTPVTIHMYVRDCDAVFKKAVDAGAIVKRPLKDEFYGDRTSTVEDPFGHVWHISTHKEDLSPKELQRRGQEAMKGM